MLRIDSKFYNGMVAIYRLLVLNVLVIVFSLPVITIGASLSAFYTVLSADQARGFIRLFIESFRESFAKTLLPFGFTLMSIIFAILLYHSTTQQSNFFNLMRMIFISFLICYNLNVYIIQSYLKTRYVYQLLRTSFVFTALTLMRTILYPALITIAAWLMVKYLGEFIIVIIFAAFLAIYFQLIKKPLVKYLSIS